MRAGAGAVPDATRAVLVLNVDQPRPRSVISQLIAAHGQAKKLISVPLFEGKRGHPAVLDGWLLPDLRSVHERTQGLRALLERYAASIAEVPFDSDVVLLDINSPAEYEKARASYFEKVAK